MILCDLFILLTFVYLQLGIISTNNLKRYWSISSSTQHRYWQTIIEGMNDERFLVSGWEDDLHDIDETRNPKGKLSVIT